MIRRTKGTVVAGFALAATAALAHTRGVEVADIVGKTKSLYASTATAEVKFEQSGSGGATSGTLYYAKGNRYRLELSGQTTVSDGKKTWLYIPAKNQVVISKASAAKGRLTPSEILTSFPGEYNVKLTGDATVNGRGVWVVRCTPGSGDRIGDVTGATLYIDKGTYRFQQIDVESPTLGQMKIRIVSAKYGAKIADGRFTMTPPQGAKVIDLSR